MEHVRHEVERLERWTDARRRRTGRVVRQLDCSLARNLVTAATPSCLNRSVSMDLVRPSKARVGDCVAVVSPSWAASEFYPAVHEQAMRRLTEITGLVPVEFPTTRRTSTPQQRANDLNEAFADPDIRAVVAVIGGDDQITVIPHLDPALPRADPKPFLGYSDNTNLVNWLWCHGVAGFYGGSSQLHLGPGPAVDPCHATSLRAALLTGERIEITDPGESEDVGKRWDDPAALVQYREREATGPWVWAGPERSVTGPTWGGCAEVLQWILTAGRFPMDPSVLAGGVLLFETSEELIPAREFACILRSLGERDCPRHCRRSRGGPTPSLGSRTPAHTVATLGVPRRAMQHRTRPDRPLQPRCGGWSAARVPDSRLRGLGGLELSEYFERGSVPEPRMQSSLIVEHADVFCNSIVRFPSGREHGTMHKFFLQ